MDTLLQTLEHTKGGGKGDENLTSPGLLRTENTPLKTALRTDLRTQQNQHYPPI